MHRRLCHILTVCACGTGVASAQDFLAVPYVVTSEPAVFAALFTRARAEGVHAAMIGDSQETCALGRGVEYMPAFNAEWARHYGATPRTPLVQPGQNFGVGQPPAEWLVAGQMLWPFIGDPSPISTAAALPGLANWPLNAPSGGQRGWMAVLQPRASDVASTIDLDRTRAWLDTSQGVYLDVYTLRSEGNVRVQWSVTSSTQPQPSAAVLGQAVTSVETADPATGEVARCRFGPITWPQNSGCLEVEFIGADASRPARMVSAGFAAVANPVGLAVTDIAAGGYNSGSLLANHAQAMGHFRAMGFDCAFISFGANDGNGYSAATFKANLTALIAAVREHVGHEIPVVILNDPLSRLWNAQSIARAELYPRAAAELATEMPRVCAVNSRRLTHEAGWTSTGSDPFLVDGVHYTAAGAMLKARLEVQAVWDAFVCPPDIGVQGGQFGHDGLLDNNDFIAFIDAFFTASSVADMGSQGGVPGSDGRFDNNDFIVFIDVFFSACDG